MYKALLLAEGLYTFVIWYVGVMELAAGEYSPSVVS
jgi:hypothetical protein